MPISTGAISSGTQVMALGTRGIITYVEATGGIATVRDGNVSGKLLATVPAGASSNFSSVEFSNGLYVGISAGTALVHIG